MNIFYYSWKYTPFFAIGRGFWDWIHHNNGPISIIQFQNHISIKVKKKPQRITFLIWTWWTTPLEYADKKKIYDSFNLK